jgi:hypothetical protein
LIRNRNRLIAEKTDQTGSSYPRELGNLLQMDEPLGGLVTRNDGAEKDDENDEEPGDVLDAAQSIGESLGRLASCQIECDPQGYGRRGISDIVDGIGEKSDAARCEHHDELQHGRGGEDHE